MTRPHRRRVLIDPTDEHGGPYRVRFRFDRELIEYLKAIIDKTERRYDPATRTWFVASWWLDAVIEEFCACGYDVWVDGQAWPTHRDDPPGASRSTTTRRTPQRISRNRPSRACADGPPARSAVRHI